MPDQPSYDAVDWRFKALETVQAAMQLDIYNERIARENATRELRKDIRDEYMTRDQLRSDYVQKKDVLVTRREKREWWALIPVWLAGVVAMADIIVQVFGH